MAQLRRDQPRFEALNTQVLVAVPNGPRTIEKKTSGQILPYPILSDKGSTVAEKYGISVRKFRLVDFTTMTITLFLIDRMGNIRYARYPTSYLEEPDTNAPLSVLAQMARQSQNEATCHGPS